MDILAFAVPLLMLGVTIWFFLRMRRPRKTGTAKDDHSTRLGRAVWAWANVVASEHAPADASGRARVELELDVHLPGSQPYTARTAWLVEQEALGFVEKGKEISLKVDPLDPKYIYPNGPWAKFAE